MNETKTAGDRYARDKLMAQERFIVRSNGEEKMEKMRKGKEGGCPLSKLLCVNARKIFAQETKLEIIMHICARNSRRKSFNVNFKFVANTSLEYALCFC